MKFFVEMVNASLNWAALTGIALVLWSLLTLPDSVPKIIFFLGKSGDYELEPLVRRFLLGLRALGRSFSCLISGMVLFFQGWRLDPILQLVVFMLTAGIIVESFSVILYERKERRSRIVESVIEVHDANE